LAKGQDAGEGGFEGVFGGEVEPADVCEAFEPGALGFGKFSGVDFDLLDGVANVPPAKVNLEAIRRTR
jgi:hypothetical protein